jgi:LDH2 family malate/lactate/ureidoglycolate dehydrogenase
LGAEKLLQADHIRTFASTVLMRIGMGSDDAAVVADALAWADLRGISAQGLSKLPVIVARVRAGGTAARPPVRIVSETAAVTVYDAASEWGQVSGARAMRAAVRKAAGTGVAMSIVRNAGSLGALGYYAMLAAEQGQIGLAVNNSSPLLQAWGGTKPILGNQGFAVGAPSGGPVPLLLDTALSSITLTRIHELLAARARLPDGVAVNSDGRPTTDPREALAGGLLPSGGHRGFGLAIMFEVLTGVLSGGACFADSARPLSELNEPQGVSQFFLAIDPRVVMPLAEFTSRVDALVEAIHRSPPAPGVDRVRVPGERAAALAVGREHDGVPFAESELLKLQALGTQYGVALGS